MIEIDGAQGEGGGAILRAALALSAITKKPFKIINVRRGRSKPGLQPQHLMSVNAAAKLCNAKVEGAKLGGTEITVIPNEIKGGNYKFDILTAGSVTLLLQTLVPIAIYADKQTSFEIIGGTDVSWSPSINYFEHIFCYYMQKLGINIECEIKQRGFYPRGGGQVIVKISKCKSPRTFNILEQGEFKRINVISTASKTLGDRKVAERQIKGFESKFPKEFAIKDKKIEYVDSFSPGTSFYAHTYYTNCKLGVCSVGEKSKPAEKVGEECAEALLKEMNSGATLDHRMADQILLYLALAKGESQFKTSRISNHLKTNAWVIEKFLPVKFEIKDNIISIKV